MILILWEVFTKIKKKRRGRKKNYFEGAWVDNTDKFLKKFPLIYKVKDNYVRYLGVISIKSNKHNNGIAIFFILISTVFTILLSVLLFIFMNLWYVVLVIASITLYLINYSFLFYLKIKLRKIHKQFASAIQLFTDYYMTSRSIKGALNESYKDMPKEVGIVFERLARRLASGYDYEKPINEFAEGLSYVWGYAFSELLIMSYEKAGDISEDLLFLNELINDDIQDEEETKSEMANNKIIFLALNGCTFVAFLINIIKSPLAKQLYFYTPTGNTLLMSWLGVIALGITISMVLENM